MHPGAWQLTEDLDEFLAEAGAFLRSRPAPHTLQLTVADALRRRGPRVFGEETPFFGMLRGPDGSIRATLLRTPPHPLHLTPLDEDAADALAARLADLGHVLTGVCGEHAATAAFAGAWQRRTGAAAEIRHRQRLYRLDGLTVPQPLPEGRARVAGAADRDLLARWYGEFADATGQHATQDPGAWVDARLSYGGLTLWETPAGAPVAMAGATQETAGQVRVAPVYTPAHLRGRGYAGAVTAEVSRVARAAGAEVLLFTDLANPTSNGLYQRIGYRGVADFAVWEFADRGR
ncbi:GNAT family N-acetyltransferase [Streptomyces sp. NBC_00820]|uniref:GNAT family N-acetyltransferase n=1 Tax=Streptomyces sp. NBC_00820 TaxID=2975842 RepID=UPI002ED6779E|nr:GNAT family N-acetyltransferase [Streptomyces sp. NBC_00820]